jgi:hypothetical protein
MATVTQQPASLEMVGNIPKIRISSAVAITVKLLRGSRVLLEEEYAPNSSGEIEIDIREVVDNDLSVALPGDQLVTVQDDAARDYDFQIAGVTAFSFRAVKAGVARLSGSSSSFLSENWLTWQPQVKRVRSSQPECLSYYAQAEAQVVVRVYHADGTTATQSVATLSAGKLHTISVGYAFVAGAFPPEEPSPVAWDVWVAIGEDRLTYIQRYILFGGYSDQRTFLFVNSLGGIDTLICTGRSVQEHSYSPSTALMSDALAEYFNEIKETVQQHTGFLTLHESRWIQDFFRSYLRFYLSPDGMMFSIVAAEEIKGERASDGDLTSFVFVYAISEQTRYLNVPRIDVGDLVIQDPEGSLFFYPHG